MSHKFSLHSSTPSVVTPDGEKTAVNRSSFPILRGLSLYRLVLKERGFREPHWHANADELGYCLAGRALVTIFASGNVHAQFTVSAGEMFFVPSGSLHAIENVGSGDSQFVITFSHEQPEDFGLSGFVGCMSLPVMGNTWNLPAEALAGLTRSKESIEFGRSASPCEVPDSASDPSPFKFAIESRAPLLANAAGSAIVARRDTWPALRSQAMYSVRIHGAGMREPHWHPETAELGFVHQGHARMTVQSPGGASETYELEPGDIYFIPRAYPHHIENLDGTEVHFLIFFDTPDVQDIGLTGAIPGFPQRMIGPTLGLAEALVARIPRLPADRLMVGRVNPVD
ncbi:MAG: cupin domain-containing protein [Verrucomicrobiae bacterium]|nr:cupin domain-containing protein [Verrucomicrobiae bacterium]